MHELKCHQFLEIFGNDSQIVQIYISSLGKLKNMNYKFKQYLTNDDIKIIETITKKTAKRAGYVFEIFYKRYKVYIYVLSSIVNYLDFLYFTNICKCNQIEPSQAIYN